MGSKQKTAFIVGMGLSKDVIRLIGEFMSYYDLIHGFALMNKETHQALIGNRTNGQNLWNITTQIFKLMKQLHNTKLSLKIDLKVCF